MKTIYKYKLDITDTQNVLMPNLAEILTVQLQDDRPVLWALVDPNGSPSSRVIEVYGTGNPIDETYSRKYISTCQLSNGLVFHFFETVFE